MKGGFNGLSLGLVLVVAACQASGASSGPSATPNASADAAIADEIRALENERHAALVDGNVDAARDLMAEDFQLVDPTGAVSSRGDYLASVSSGLPDYLSWDVISPIEVRLHGDGAVLWYRSRIEVSLDGTRIPGEFWHIDVYEKRDGRWLAVRAQTTQVGQ